MSLPRARLQPVDRPVVLLDHIRSEKLLAWVTIRSKSVWNIHVRRFSITLIMSTNGSLFWAMIITAGAAVMVIICFLCCGKAFKQTGHRYDLKSVNYDRQKQISVTFRPGPSRSDLSRDLSNKGSITPCLPRQFRTLREKRSTSMPASISEINNIV